MTPPTPDRFEAWLRHQPGLSAQVVSIVAADGGASNVTCKVTLKGGPFREVCLRLQRQRGIFEPYNVIREGRVLQALQGTGIPVPQLLAGEAGGGGLGAPFIVTEWIDAPHMGIAGPEADFGAFVEMVARIHAVDWESHGLAFLATTRDVATAIRQEIDAIAARMPGFGVADDAVLLRALDALRSHVPADGELRLCQGDINVFNYLFRNRTCVGVVDWEQARISDSRSDVGHLLCLSILKGAPFGPVGDMPFLRAYETASGRQLAGMEYFRARWAFELAVIYHGWVAFNGTEPWFSREQVEGLLVQSIAELS